MSTSGGGTNIEVNVDASQAIQSFERLKAEYRESVSYTHLTLPTKA